MSSASNSSPGATASESKAGSRTAGKDGGGPRGSIGSRILNRLENRYETLRPRQAFILILFVAAIARFSHLFLFDTGRPIVMGGLFLEFARQIYENGFLPPATIPFYSENGVPFLYPPLVFYITAILIHGLGFDPAAVMNWLPPLLSLLSVVLFHGLARRLFEDWRHAALATLFFALIPNAYSEHVEAAGLAESLGMVVIVLFLRGLYALREHPSLKRAGIAGAILGICVLASPGSAYGGAVTALFFAALWLRGGLPLSGPLFRERFLRLALCAGVSVLVAAPYLIHIATVQQADSIGGVFGHHAAVNMFGRLFGALTHFSVINPSLFLWQVLVAIGLILGLIEPRFRLAAAWTALIYFGIAREGRWLAAPGFAVLAALAFWRLYEWLAAHAQRHGGSRRPIFGLFAGFLLLLYILFPLASPIRAAFGAYPELAETRDLSDDAYGAFAWAKANTPEDARFAIIANPILLEVAPHFMRRTVINVYWGGEFEPQEAQRILDANQVLETCGQRRDCFAALMDGIGTAGPVYFLVKTAWDDRHGFMDGGDALRPAFENGQFRIYRMP